MCVQARLDTDSECLQLEQKQLTALIVEEKSHRCMYTDSAFPGAAFRSAPFEGKVRTVLHGYGSACASVAGLD